MTPLSLREERSKQGKIKKSSPFSADWGKTQNKITNNVGIAANSYKHSLQST